MFTFLQRLKLTTHGPFELDEENNATAQQDNTVWPTTHEPYLYR